MLCVCVLQEVKLAPSTSAIRKKAVLGNNEKCSETTATASHDFAKGDFVGVVYNDKWHLGKPLMSVSV